MIICMCGGQAKKIIYRKLDVDRGIGENVCDVLPSHIFTSLLPDKHFFPHLAKKAVSEISYTVFVRQLSV